MIYIQSDGGIPYSFDSACAMYAAIAKQTQYELIRHDATTNLPNEMILKKIANDAKTNLFIGTVEFLTPIFKELGVNPRCPLNSNRAEENILIGEARERIRAGEELFVKPYEIKQFTGMVLDKRYVGYLRDYPDHTKVIVTKPFDSEIVSEWRCYVHGETIIGIGNYAGDEFIIPNKRYVEDTIRSAAKNFPIAYTIDVGVLKDGRNVVVEFNDMWAIGNYGLSNTLYLNLLQARWREIMKT